jgi:hypothetical protein
MCLIPEVGDRWILRTRLIALGFVLIAVPLGSAPPILVELFPSEDRLTGYSNSFNLGVGVGVGVVGGITPMPCDMVNQGNWRSARACVTDDSCLGNSCDDATLDSGSQSRRIAINDNPEWAIHA